VTVDIYFAGVGGQGIITASRILGEAALLAGRNVLLSETHGMAQRGGSVVCTARIGDVHSPLIEDGQADAIVSLELLEALRALCKASNKTVVMTSTEMLVPLSVSTQKLRYPTVEEVEAEVRRVARAFIPIDARGIAFEAGVPMSSNVVMIGALAGTGVTGVEKRHFEQAIGTSIPKSLAQNLVAFSRGFEATKGLGLS